MRNRHELKTVPLLFKAVVTGSKKFEYRNNDRFFAVGDILILREFDPIHESDPYTGYFAKVVVGEVWDAAVVPELPVTHVLMSIQLLDYGFDGKYKK